MGFYFVSRSQDEIITREYQYDPDPNLVITRAYDDTIYYRSYNKMEKIATENVIAIRRNYKERNSKYVFIRSNEQRIYGFKSGNAFFKADYRFSIDIPEELAKLYFMEKFRAYEEVPTENITHAVFIINKETGEKLKLPLIKGFYINFKSDMLHRDFKAKVYSTTFDTTQLIIKADISGESNIYSIPEEYIESISIQSDGATAGRVAMGIVSQGASWQFYQNKWLTKYDFKVWRLSW